MLWTIAVVLLALWGVGSVLPFVAGFAILLVRVVRRGRRVRRLTP